MGCGNKAFLDLGRDIPFVEIFTTVEFREEGFHGVGWEGREVQGIGVGEGNWLKGCVKDSVSGWDSKGVVRGREELEMNVVELELLSKDGEGFGHLALERSEEGRGVKKEI